MIEVVKIEDFVLYEMFYPFMPTLVHYGDKNTVDDIKEHPEKIIESLDSIPEFKEKVIRRLKRGGGVKWYRYLDMSNPVIRWVNENLEEGNG